MGNSLGFTDSMATEDLFGIQKYIDGLSDFILSCKTPMTISIQGSWGTGKTSIMNFIYRKLEKSTCPVWFNTWQFSQFNQQDQLAESMITRMMAQMDANEETKSKINYSKGLLSVTKTIASVFGKESIVDNAVETYKSFADNKATIIPDDAASVLADLKANFTDAVNQTIARHPEINRLVFYIDDLDRLEPKKAVELLEVMKLFFDVEGCVFILAIDYDVVVKGVSAKYGKFSENSEENEAKGRSFFDKIIQVPFKMPIGEYDIKNYIKGCLYDIGITADNDLLTYEALIKNSIGTNPRSMKRIFNSFLLLNMVKKDNTKDSSNHKKILFALLCMQYAYEGAYNYLLKKRHDITGEELKQIADEEDEESLAKIIGSKELKGVDLSRLQSFLRFFISLIDGNGDGVIDDENEMIILRDIMDTTSITSMSSEGMIKNKSEEKAIRWKKTTFQYRGKQYISGSRGGNNIGFLAHDIIKNAVADNHWTISECEEFRKAYYKKGKTGWLNEVILFEQEAIILPSTENWRNNDAKDGNGNPKTASLEEFAHYFINNFTAKDGEAASFSREDIPRDSLAIELADGEKIFTARYFGDKDVDKIASVLHELGIDIQYERNYI